MPKPFIRYLFATFLLLYSALQIVTQFVPPFSNQVDLLIQDAWLFGFAGWYVIIFGIVLMSPAILYLGFALAHRNNLEGLSYHKEPLTELEPLPEKLMEWESELRSLGFELFGMYRGTHAKQSNNNYTARVYVNSERDVYVDLVLNDNGISAIEFVTEFADGFQLGTLYNLALNVDSDIIYCRSFKGSISEAHAYHVYQVDLRAEQHGAILKTGYCCRLFTQPGAG